MRRPLTCPVPSPLALVGLCALPLLTACPRKGKAEVAHTPTEEASAATLEASQVVGDWSGVLKVPGKGLRLVLHLTEEEEGRLSASLDSPDQGAFGLVADEVRLEGDQVTVRLKQLHAKYVGRVTTDRMEGTFTQGGVPFSLNLERGEAPAPTLDRPQEPKPPFPYTAEEVTVPSVEGVTLAGTFTIPEGEGPFPAVALLTGSGPQDRDESLLGHRPFAVLADHLTRAGVAVLRTDDRGVAGSTGDFSTATTADFAEDAAHALAWLADRPETGAVGWIGHSEGGLIAPLAHVRPDGPRADFMVLLAGPAVSGAEILLEQSALIGAASGTPAEDLERARAHSAELYQVIHEGGEDVRERAMAKLREAPAVAELPDEEVAAAVDPLLTPWLRWFLAYDPLPTLQQLDVPVLALYGELDLQVPPHQSEQLMREALGEHGTVEVFPGLNHLFQPATTGSPQEYATIPITLDPAVLHRVGEWILSL